jgi:hypothetical protein
MGSCLSATAKRRIYRTEFCVRRRAAWVCRSGVLPREMRPPKPRPEATVCTMTRGNIAELIATALSRYSLFLLPLRTMGYRGKQCSGGRTLLRTHGEKLQPARGISAKSRNSSVILRQVRTIGYWGKLWRRNGGESGIRTHGTVSRTHAFQACALSHSAISPAAFS